MICMSNRSCDEVPIRPLKPTKGSKNGTPTKTWTHLDKVLNLKVAECFVSLCPCSFLFNLARSQEKSKSQLKVEKKKKVRIFSKAEKKWWDVRKTWWNSVFTLEVWAGACLHILTQNPIILCCFLYEEPLLPEVFMWHSDVFHRKARRPLLSAGRALPELALSASPDEQ